MEKIYNPTSVNMLLGCLLQDSSLVLSDKYPLDKDDFCLSFQKFIYVSVVNLYKQGYKKIEYKELDKYLSKYPEQYEVFKDCGGRGNVEDFIETIVELSDLENYDGYYNDVRKLSILRDYRDNGIDIEKFWNYNVGMAIPIRITSLIFRWLTRLQKSKWKTSNDSVSRLLVKRSTYPEKASTG